jgi:hypothetical protein
MYVEFRTYKYKMKKKCPTCGHPPHAKRRCGYFNCSDFLLESFCETDSLPKKDKNKKSYNTKYPKEKLGE